MIISYGNSTAENQPLFIDTRVGHCCINNATREPDCSVFIQDIDRETKLSFVNLYEIKCTVQPNLEKSLFSL